MKKDTIEWLYNWTKDKDLVTVEELLTAFEKFKEPSNPTKQTAVDWFYQRILAKDIKAVFEQAKEMEKEQIEEAFFKGDLFAEDYFDADNPTKDVSENYYKQTYESNT
jgi:hypothetical protein